MLKQNEIGLALLAIRKTMNIIDDGYHQEEYFELTKISNRLYSELNTINQQKFKTWLETKGLSF